MFLISEKIFILESGIINGFYSKFNFCRKFDVGKGVKTLARLERIESVKAKERQGSRTDITKNPSECLGETAQIVAITSLQKRIPQIAEP